MSNTYQSIVDEILKSTPQEQASETEGAKQDGQQAQQEQQVEPKEQEQVTNQQQEDPNEAPVKAWYDDEEQVEQQTPQQQEQPAQQQEQPQQPQIEEDEDIKLIKEYKKQGKSLKDFVKEYNVVDYNSLEDNKILEMGLKELEGFSGDDFEDAKNEVESMTLFQKKKLVQEYRAKFNQVNEEKLKKLSYVDPKFEEAQKQMIERFNNDLESSVSSITNQERYGLKVTDEMSKTIKRFVAEEMNFTKPDGSVDVETLLDVALWLKYGKELVRANVTRAKNEGREEILRQTTNPSTGIGSSNMSAGFSNDNLSDAFTQYLNNKK